MCLVSKFQRKSQNPENTVVLSANARTRLEELMMEGDLLEVALDETQHIWRIVSNANNPTTVRKYAAFEEVQANFNVDMKDAKKRGRKRKSDDFDLVKNIARPKIDDKTIVKKKGFPPKDNKKIINPPSPLKRGPRKVIS